MKPGILLQLEKVSVKLGVQTVLHPIDLTIHEGEHWVVTGPSGSQARIFHGLPWSM